MVHGPQVERLNKAVIGTDPGVVNRAATEWGRCGTTLQKVSEYLANASGTVKWAIGGETGPAVDAAFKRSAEAMAAKAQVMNEAVAALVDAGAAMHVAQQAAATMQGMEQPAEYTAPGDADEAQLAKEAKSKAAQKAFAKAFAEQEEKARIEADELEATFAKSAATMKKIHGEPDPPPPPLPPSDDLQTPGNGGSSNGTTGHSVTPTHLTGHIGQQPQTEIGLIKDPQPTYDYVPNHPGSEVGTGTTGVGTTGSSGTPIDYVPGTGSGSSGGIGSALGVGGATAGGMAAGLLGAKLTGALKGGLFPTSGGAATAGRGTASSAVRGIGSSARTGGAGTIGKSGAAAGSGAAGKSAAGTGSGAGRSGAGGAGRSGAGGAGRSGAGSGARAGAGGRGGAGGRTGAGPTGRSGRGKDDEKGKKHELFDVGEDWVDDEGAAPGVLD